MNPDGRIFNFLGKLGDFFILNIMYLIACIPIVTIGAATTALYYNTLKMAEDRESYVWKDFWKAFKENFKQSTIIWMIILIIGGILAADSILVKGMHEQLGAVVSIVTIIVFIFLALEVIYVFPVLARFDNTVANTMKNALLMSIRHLPSTIVIVFLHAAPLLLIFISLETFLKGALIVLLFTVSILAYGESKFFSRIFSNYYPKDQEYDFAQQTRGGITTWRNRQK